jgi:acetyl-CoA carboxylase biotin carboxyl carrier protein
MSQSKNKQGNGGSEARRPMDIKHIKSLVELMVENDLSRVELREGDTHILLRRGQAPGPAPAPAAGNPTGLATGTASARATPPPDSESSNEILIRSPMVGTFYAAPDPESPPFVTAGTQVAPDTVVCLLEAMKVFNELKAEVSGRIIKVLVRNAEAVEYDQPLFAVVPA